MKNRVNKNNPPVADHQGKKKLINVDKPGKKEKYSEYEEFEMLEDFDDFVKTTGWKTKGNSNQVKNKKSEQNRKHERNSNTGQVGGQGQTGRQGQAGRHGPNDRSERSFHSKHIIGSEKDIRVDRNNERGYKSKPEQTGRADRSGLKSAANISHIRKTVSELDIAHKNKTLNPSVTKKRNSRSVDTLKQEHRQKNTSNSSPSSACPHMRECGGCNILRESYQVHLSEKQKEVDKLLKKYCKIEPIIGMEKPENYRNKVHVVFDHDRKGNPVSGVYEEGTHRVVPIVKCRIHNEKADAIIATIRGMLKSFKILTYDEDTGYGLLRHVLIRTGYHSGEILVVLVLASPILPSKNNFVKALLKDHPEITSVVINMNDKKTSMVLGEKEQVIYGKGYIEDVLCGKTFRISPKSFYQVNPQQTEVLYRKAIELAKLNGEEIVVDAYCGIGTIGLIASEHAKKVIGVELNKDAVRDAVSNAKRNHTDNIEFYQNDAGVFLSQMAAAGDRVDVVIMDPPRTGSTNQFLDAVASIRPKKVIYISCNPVTLERDLDYLTKKGFKAEVAVPVDMFPWTSHVETIIMMTKCGSEGKK